MTMDSLPLTAALLGKLFPIKGSDIERYYKHHLSDYEVWTQKEHATDWVLLPENIGEYLSIDETQLCEEVYTILSIMAGKALSLPSSRGQRQILYHGFS